VLSAQQKQVFKPLIIPETPDHARAVERVLDRAFGPGRFAKISERVREFAVHAPTLSRVVLADGALVGVCRIYYIRIGPTPALFLGPLAVDPAAQHSGIGHALVSETLDACRVDHAARPVLLMGQPAFFNTLGFVQAPDTVIMSAPIEARRLLWLGLKDGALDGVAGPVNAPG
jgi:predicted N-acetyltransferase YhbS